MKLDPKDLRIEDYHTVPEIARGDICAAELRQCAGGRGAASSNTRSNTYTLREHRLGHSQVYTLLVLVPVESPKLHLRKHKLT